MALLMQPATAMQQRAALPALSRRTCVACRASTSSSKPSTSSCKPSNTWAGAKAAAAAAAAAACLLVAPVQPAAATTSLASLVPQDFSFVDANRDGVLSLDEFRTASQQVAQEEDFTAPPDEVLEFSMKLFDFNGDGILRPQELLTGFALDAVVSEDQIDAGAVKTFDPNADGQVDLREWSAPFGDLGENGEAVKAFVFKRVDSLQNRDGKLGVQTAELGDALNLMRSVLMGY